jgi:hypothetical protein
VITFYSYKGGVGRSMTLANLAWVLASNGKRVLTVDMHLDAPGLHRYFAPFLSDPELTSSAGMIEYLTSYVQAAASRTGDPATGWLREQSNILRYAVSLEWDFAAGGSLDFVPAGRQGSSYSVLVNELDWNVLYERFGGAGFLSRTAQRMREEYDYVLIDSPTGVGTVSSVCTILLPDALVVCFALNRQSILGAANVTRSVRSQRDAKLEVFPVASEIFPVAMRVDISEKLLVDSSRELAYRAFAGLTDAEIARRDYWTGVEIPYVPYYSYGEVLAPFVDTSRQVQSVLASVERLAGHITQGEITRTVLPSETERIKVLTAFQASPRGDPPLF